MNLVREKNCEALAEGIVLYFWARQLTLRLLRAPRLEV